jgi:hypothetical protein
MLPEWLRSLGVITAALAGFLAFLAVAALAPALVLLVLPDTVRDAVCGGFGFCAVPLGLLGVSSATLALALLYRYWDTLPLGSRRYDGQ